MSKGKTHVRDRNMAQKLQMMQIRGVSWAKAKTILNLKGNKVEEKKNKD